MSLVYLTQVDDNTGQRVGDVFIEANDICLVKEEPTFHGVPAIKIYFEKASKPNELHPSGIYVATDEDLGMIEIAKDINDHKSTFGPR